MKEDLILLLKSFDGNLTPAEKFLLDDALARSPERARERDAMETMRQDLASARSESFSYGFAAKTVAAMVGRSKEYSRQFEAFENMKSAFFGTAAACATACLVLFLWIRFHPNPQTTTPSSMTQSVEDALQNITNKAVEEIL